MVTYGKFAMAPGAVAAFVQMTKTLKDRAPSKR